MKKIVLISCAVLLLSVLSANATMVIAVNIGDGIWADYPDSKLVIKPSDKILIGVFGSSRDWVSGARNSCVGYCQWAR